MDQSDSKKLKERIIEAGYKAVNQLIAVAEEKIIGRDDESENGDSVELAADRLKNAAATKKLAIFDAFEILSRIESEKENISSNVENNPRANSKQGFAERRAGAGRTIQGR
jgi:hypothetical protein